MDTMEKQEGDTTCILRSSHSLYADNVQRDGWAKKRFRTRAGEYQDLEAKKKVNDMKFYDWRIDDLKDEKQKLWKVYIYCQLTQCQSALWLYKVCQWEICALLWNTCCLFLRNKFPTILIRDTSFIQHYLRVSETELLLHLCLHGCCTFVEYNWKHSRCITWSAR